MWTLSVINSVGRTSTVASIVSGLYFCLRLNSITSICCDFVVHLVVHLLWICKKNFVQLLYRPICYRPEQTEPKQRSSEFEQ